MKKISFLSVILLFLTLSATAQSGKDSINMIINLDEIHILSSYARNNREKPVVLSNITSKQILTKLSNQEFPEIMKLTPSIYASKMGGGYGDSRITLRGFSSENVSLLLNGIPVNGMENGAIYWSNWSGLADIANSIQVQRGIGLSRLGLYSLGGTMNIITNGAVASMGGHVQYDIGNDGYQKVGFSFSTGQSKNGWAATVMASRTSGNGYVMGTNFEAWSYFLSLNKRFNDRHSLAFTAFGAPQWHNKRGNKQTIEDYKNRSEGLRLNTNMGYMNGKVVNTYGGYNEYHKPQLSLTHFWHIGARASLTTSVYASMASGGGRKVYGAKYDANRIQYDFNNGKPIYDKGELVTDMTGDGYIDYYPLMKDNRESETGSKAIFTMGTNSHNWYGAISNYVQPLGERFVLSGGIDIRYYKGFHYDEIENLLGGSHFIDNSLAWREKDVKLGVGDRISSDYYSEITWLGLFAQLEYKAKNIEAFVAGSFTDHNYRRTDKGKYGEYGNQTNFPKDKYKSDLQSFNPFGVKAGVNYHFTDKHRLFVNGAYMTKAPMMDNIYTNNDFIKNANNEKVISGEFGYNFTSNKIDILLNGYITSWKDKSTTKAIGAWNGPRACIPNLDALHKGIELTAHYSPCKSLLLSGFFTIGDWRWVDDIDFTYIDEQGKEVGQYHAYIKGLRVGNAPQTSGYLSASWNGFGGLTIGADFNYYARHYADFSPIDRTTENDRGQSWKLPSYETVDLNVNYEFITSKCSIQIFGNINNLFNKRYISDAVDNKIAPKAGEKGHKAENAVVWYGFGTTWTTGIKVKF